MKKIFLSAIFLFATSPLLHAATIAIIDSGVDYNHEALASKMWTNPKEIPENTRDDDNNGKIDDIHGWNYTKNNNQIIDYSIQSNYTPDIERFFYIQARSMNGQVTDSEKQWARNATKDAAFLKKLQSFGGYSHGTHVAGIATRGIDDVKILAIKIIPTPKSLNDLKIQVKESLLAGKEVNWVKQFVFKLGLKLFASAQGTIFSEVGNYLHENQVAVANGSFGLGMAQARAMVAPILKLLLREAPTSEQVDEYATFFVNQAVDAQAKAFGKTPDILYVFAAGNDGSDNEVLPTAPANIRSSNVITVGATISNVAIAPFSNYGATKVDVFAPGVGIRSSIPMGNKYMSMSGTSMAAPEVTRVALSLKNLNPNLSAADLRTILMGTVDHKDYLKGKAYTEGVVNDSRAQMAAEYSRDMDVREAVRKARLDVNDKPEVPLTIEDPIVFFSPM